MPTERHFVGRRGELARFRQVLDDPVGRAVLIVGQQAMGKSFLARRMLESAESHPSLTCGTVSYEVTATDPPEAVMERMLEDGFAATQTEGSFSASPHRRRQWEALMRVVVPRGRDLMKLKAALRRNPKRPAREQLVAALTRLSSEVPDDRRVVFLLDSEKRMHADSDQAWRLVVKDLPPKVVLLFAQRPDDSLAASSNFQRLGNVLNIPDSPLPPLASDEVDELLDLCLPRLPYSKDDLRNHFARLGGHPYAVGAFLDLLLDGVPVGELPTDPDGIASEQWQRVLRFGESATRLLEAYAILEVPVPEDLACHVAELELRAQRSLLAEPYLAGLLPSRVETVQGEHRQIYHSLLAETVRSSLSPTELRELHSRAAAAYLERLRTASTADALTALRLPEHVLHAKGAEAFARVVADQAAHRLHDLGFVEEAEDLLRRAVGTGLLAPPLHAALLNPLGRIQLTRGDLDAAEETIHRGLQIYEELGNIKEVASSLGNLGVIHRVRGDLVAAESMATRSLVLHEQLGARKAMANQYGNLATIHRTRGDLDRAEQMAKRSLEVSEELEDPDGIADALAHLGLIYRDRQDLDRACEVHVRSLRINRELGRLEGMAGAYDNLGVIYQICGEFRRAEEAHKASLAINQKLGRLEGVANAYGNLATLYQSRGDLDQAEELHNRSLAVSGAMGLLEGMANTYGNLGWISQARGDLKSASFRWAQSLELFRQIGARDKAAAVEAWLDKLGEPKAQDTTGKDSNERRDADS